MTYSQGRIAGLKEAAEIADAKAADCETRSRQHPEHTLKFIRDCAVAQTIASGIRALAEKETPDARHEYKTALIRRAQARGIRFVCPQKDRALSNNEEACEQCDCIDEAAPSDITPLERELLDGCKAVLGLCTLLIVRNDLPAAVRAALTDNHRVHESRAVIAKAEKDGR